MLMLLIACMIADLEDEFELLESTLSEGVESALSQALADLILKNEQIRDLQNKGILSAQTQVAGPTDKIIQVISKSGTLNGNGQSVVTNVADGTILEVSILGDPGMTCSEVSDGVLATGANADVEAVSFDSATGQPSLVRKTMLMNYSCPGTKMFVLTSPTAGALGSIQVTVLKPRSMELEALQ